MEPLLYYILEHGTASNINLFLKCYNSSKQIDSFVLPPLATVLQHRDEPIVDFLLAYPNFIPDPKNYSEWSQIIQKAILSHDFEKLRIAFKYCDATLHYRLLEQHLSLAYKTDDDIFIKAYLNCLASLNKYDEAGALLKEKFEYKTKLVNYEFTRKREGKEKKESAGQELKGPLKDALKFKSYCAFKLLLDDVRSCPDIKDLKIWAKLLMDIIAMPDANLLKILLAKMQNLFSKTELHKIFKTKVASTYRYQSFDNDESPEYLIPLIMKEMADKEKKAAPDRKQAKDKVMQSEKEGETETKEKTETKDYLETKGHLETKRETKTFETSTLRETAASQEISLSPYLREVFEVFNLLWETDAFAPSPIASWQWNKFWWRIFTESEATAFPALQKVLEKLSPEQQEQFLNDSFTYVSKDETLEYSWPSFFEFLFINDIILHGDDAELSEFEKSQMPEKYKSNPAVLKLATILKPILKTQKLFEERETEITKAIQYFLAPDRKINIAALDNIGNNILHNAVITLNVNVLKILLQDKRLNIDTQSKEGLTPIMELLQFADLFNNPELPEEFFTEKDYKTFNTKIAACMDLLLEQPIDLSLKTKDGLTLIDILSLRNHDSYNTLKDNWIKKLQEKAKIPLAVDSEKKQDLDDKGALDKATDKIPSSSTASPTLLHQYSPTKLSPESASVKLPSQPTPEKSPVDQSNSAKGDKVLPSGRSSSSRIPEQRFL